MCVGGRHTLVCLASIIESTVVRMVAAKAMDYECIRAYIHAEASCVALLVSGLMGICFTAPFTHLPLRRKLPVISLLSHSGLAVVGRSHATMLV